MIWRIRALRAFGSLTKSHADAGQEQLLRNCKATIDGVEAGLRTPTDSLRPARGAVRVQGSLTWQPGLDQTKGSNPEASRRRDGIVMEVDRELVQALLNDDAGIRKSMLGLESDNAPDQQQACQDNPTAGAPNRIAQEKPAHYESSPETAEQQVQYGSPAKPAGRDKAFRLFPTIRPLSKAAAESSPGDQAKAEQREDALMELIIREERAKAFMTGAFASALVLYCILF